MKIDEVNITVLGAVKVEGTWYIDCRCEVEVDNKHNEISINTADVSPVNFKSGSVINSNKETVTFASSIAIAAICKLFGPIDNINLDRLGLSDDLGLLQKVVEFNSKS